jgi:hypothetical protein
MAKFRAEFEESEGTQKTPGCQQASLEMSSPVGIGRFFFNPLYGIDAANTAPTC